MNILEYNKLHSKLNAISTSEGISGNVVSIANKILFGIKELIAPKLMFCESGEITFYWDIGDYYIELSVDELATTVFYFIASNGKLIDNKDIAISKTTNIKIPDIIIKLCGDLAWKN